MAKKRQPKRPLKAPAIALTDADYAAIVKRYEDAGDVQNANIIRKQWEVARQIGANARQAERGPDLQD